MGLPSAPFLYPIIDVPRVPAGAVAETIRLLGRNGVRLVQLRAKALPDGELLRLAQAAAEAAGEGGSLLIVNDRADVARLCGAAGVHVGQGDLPASAARQVLGKAAIIGRSTHSVEQVERALAEPIDYLAVGPIFATGSKADAEAVVGLDLIAQARKRTKATLIAIGGITPQNAPAVFASGADGVAVIAGLFAAGGVELALRRFRQAVPTLG